MVVMWVEMGASFGKGCIYIYIYFGFGSFTRMFIFGCRDSVIIQISFYLVTCRSGEFM